jgi:MoaA/NifB/PqqE/SkfB family radical SAM enzyme
MSGGKIIGMMRRLSPVRTDAFLAKRHRGVFYLTLFVTNRCNLRCRHCFYAQQMDRVPGVDMPVATASAIIKHFGRRLASVIVTGGEPLRNLRVYAA